MEKEKEREQLVEVGSKLSQMDEYQKMYIAGVLDALIAQNIHRAKIRVEQSA